MEIEDSSPAVYADWLQDPNSTFSDRGLVRAFAEANVATFEFLEHGVQFLAGPPDENSRDSTPRRMFQAQEWPHPEGVVAPNSGRNGSGIMRPLEHSARRHGVEILLEHRLDSLLCHSVNGSVVGLQASTNAGRARRGRTRTRRRQVAGTDGSGVGRN